MQNETQKELRTRTIRRLREDNLRLDRENQELRREIRQHKALIRAAETYRDEHQKALTALNDARDQYQKALREVASIKKRLKTAAKKEE